MGRGRDFLERLADQTDTASLHLSSQPILEIASDKRVLIENHFGIREYSTERIVVKVHYGCVCVCGCNLQILKMTKEQLVICGRIDGVSLLRRE